MRPSARTTTRRDGTRIALHERRRDVPVLAVSPDGDAFVTTPLQTDIARWAPNLTVKVVRGGHWMPRNDPGLVARLVREHTRQVASWGT